MIGEVPNSSEPTEQTLVGLLDVVEQSGFRLFRDMTAYGSKPSGDNFEVIADTAAILTDRMGAAAKHILQLDSTPEQIGTMLQGIHKIDAETRAERFNTYAGKQVIIPSQYSLVIENEDPDCPWISEEERAEILGEFSDDYMDELTNDINTMTAYLRGRKNTRARRMGKTGLQALKQVSLITASATLSALIVRRLNEN